MKERTIDDVVKYLKSKRFAEELNESTDKAKCVAIWADEIANLWQKAKENPVEWCDCDKCVCKVDAKKADKKLEILKLFATDIEKMKLIMYSAKDIKEDSEDNELFIALDDIEDLNDKAWHVLADVAE